MNAPNFTLGYYQALLTSQYNGSPDQLAWLEGNLALFQDILSCANGFSQDLDLDQAIGAQLDILGVILGRSRTMTFQPSNGVSPILDDGTYRLLLQATVYRNHWNGLLADLRNIWTALFPSGVLLYTDNQNMTVSFYIAAPFTSIIEDLIRNSLILPRPQGVQYIFSFAALPLLQFDEQNAYGAGFAAVAAQTTGSTTSGSPTVTVASAAGIVVGQIVIGSGIPVNTTVSVTAGTTLTISNNATATASDVTLTFYTSDESGHFA